MQLYKLAIQATGEVRDADGNIVSSSPVEVEPIIVTEAQLRELGLHPEEKP